MSARKLGRRPRSGSTSIAAVLLLAFALRFPTSVDAQPQPIVVTTGPDGSLYSVFGQELVAYLNETLAPRFTFEAMPSDGSIDNIERLLLESRTRLTLAQEDVAHLYYTGNNEHFLVPRDEDLRVTALGRIFQEEFYFVVRPDITGPADLDTVAVAALKSGSYATYTTYRAHQRPTWAEVQTGETLELFRSGKIPAFVDVDATPHQSLDALADDGIPFRILSVRRSHFSLGLDIYRDISIPDSLSPTGVAFQTISIPALLLCSRDLPPVVAAAALRPFYDQQALDEHFPLSKAYLARLSRELRSDGTPTATDPRFLSLPIPPHPATVRLTLGRFPYAANLAFFLLFLAAVAVTLVLPRWNVTLRAGLGSRPSTKTLYRTLQLFLAAVAWTLFVVLVIRGVEVNQLLSGKTASESPFVEMSFPRVFNWLVVFAVTGFDDQAFPKAWYAKLLVISVQLAGLAVVAYAGTSFAGHFLERLIRRSRRMKPLGFSRHIVVCNWNPNGMRLLEALLAPDVPKKRRNRQIVILSESPLLEAARDAYDIVSPIAKAPWDRHSLEYVSLDAADSVIILQPEKEGDGTTGDGVVLNTALAVNNYLDSSEKYQARKGGGDWISIVAEVQDPENREYLAKFSIRETVASSDFGVRLLAETVSSPGITALYEELLKSADDSMEVYCCPIPERFVGEPPDFQAIRRAFAETYDSDNPAIPVGLRLKRERKETESSQDGDGDHNTLSAEKKFVLNPTKEDFGDHVTLLQEYDEVVVIADTPPIESQLRKIGGKSK